MNNEIYMPLSFLSITGKILDYKFRDLCFVDKNFVEQHGNIFIDKTRNAYTVVYKRWNMFNKFTNDTSKPELCKIKTDFDISVTKILGNFIINSDGHIIYWKNYDDTITDGQILSCVNQMYIFKFEHFDKIKSANKIYSNNSIKFILLLDDGRLFMANIDADGINNDRHVNTSFTLVMSDIKHFVCALKYTNTFCLITTDNKVIMCRCKFNSINLLDTIGIDLSNDYICVNNIIIDNTKKIKYAISDNSNYGDSNVPYLLTKTDISAIPDAVVDYDCEIFLGWTEFYLTSDNQVYVSDSSNSNIVKLSLPKITKFCDGWVKTGVNTSMYGVCGIDINNRVLYLGHKPIVKRITDCGNNKWTDPYETNIKIADGILLATDISITKTLD
jgi:hypothetical protein